MALRKTFSIAHSGVETGGRKVPLAGREFDTFSQHVQRNIMGALMLFGLFASI